MLTSFENNPQVNYALNVLNFLLGGSSSASSSLHYECDPASALDSHPATTTEIQILLTSRQNGPIIWTPTLFCNTPVLQTMRLLLKKMSEKAAGSTLASRLLTLEACHSPSFINNLHIKSLKMPPHRLRLELHELIFLFLRSCLHARASLDFTERFGRLYGV